MATQNRTSLAQKTALTVLPPALDLGAGRSESELRKAAHAQSNVLHDVQVLLDALRSNLEDLDAHDDDIDRLLRLAQMSKATVAGVISAFNSHI